MGAYTVLALRYRPRRFQDVIGQEDAARVLQQAFRTGRAAHAYLFSGPRGVGKTSMARILAKAFNCLENDAGDPCGRCAVCRSIDETGDGMDVVEIDGASHNRVENVRDLIENLRFRPVSARFRVTIVDEVHMLSTAAFNALLKTLEEPPSHAKFILATTEPLKVPETIRSRCQMLDFRRLSSEQIGATLAHICEQERVPANPALLQLVARTAQGGMRDALSLLDQLIVFGDGKPSLEDYERLTGRLGPDVLARLVREILAGDASAVARAAEDAFSRGTRPGDLLAQLNDVLSGLLVTVAGAEAADRTAEERAVLSELAARTNVDQVVAMLDVLVEASRRLRQRHDGRLVVQMALLTLARLPLLQPVAELLAGAPSRPAPAPAPATDLPTRIVEIVGRGSRSLNLELQRYAMRVEGDELVLVPPPGGTGLLFDPEEPTLRRQIEVAAGKAAGRPLRLRVDRSAPASAASEPNTGELGRRIRRDWPDAERVDR